MTPFRKHASPWTHVAFVASESEPGAEHEIKRHADGRMACSCMAYRFAKGVKTCKHLAAYSSASVQAVFSNRPQASAVVAGETFTVRRAISFDAIPI